MRPTPAITRAPRRYRTSGRRWIGPLALLVGLLLAAAVGISVYVGWQLTHPKPKPLTSSPQQLGLAFEPVEFPSRTDGLTLRGWFIPGRDTGSRDGAPAARPNVIFAHGYDNNRLQASAEALKLAQYVTGLGYNVLMFDFRNAGESGGTMTSVGYFEKYDLLGAIDWMKTNHPGSVALLGFSMGGTTSLLAAAEEPSVVGVIADSPFNHLTHYLRDNLPVWSHLPSFPFTPLILGILPRLTGMDPDQVDALTAVDRIYPRPVLFIHSIDDPSVPYTNSETMWQRHPDKFELWKPSGAGHARTHSRLPGEYEAHVGAFLQKLLSR